MAWLEYSHRKALFTWLLPPNEKTMNVLPLGFIGEVIEMVTQLERDLPLKHKDDL